VAVGQAHAAIIAVDAAESSGSSAGRRHDERPRRISGRAYDRNRFWIAVMIVVLAGIYIWRWRAERNR
jgi:hypothetical protein